MKTIVETTTNKINEYPFGADVGEHYVVAKDEDSYKALAKELKVSPELVEEIANAFQYQAESIKDNVSTDLRQIWKRLEALE